MNSFTNEITEMKVGSKNNGPLEQKIVNDVKTYRSTSILLL